MDIALFSVTQRTGSTLVQRIFNRNPATLMWGENGRALDALVNMRQQGVNFSDFHASERERFFSEGRPLDLDISCMSPETPIVDQATLLATRAFFDAMYPRGGFERVGFKEVLQTDVAVRLFMDAYPDAELLLLARDPVDCWMSYYPEWGPAQEFIDVWTANVEGYQKLGPILWYEDILRDSATQSRICDMARITKAQFDEVLAVRIASTGGTFEKSEADIALVKEACLPVMERARAEQA